MGGSHIEHPGNDQAFFGLLKQSGDKLVVVDFYADWCGPCRMVAPHFEKMAAQYHENAVFCKVNVDVLSGATQWAGVSAMPTFIVYRNGEKLDSIRGADVAGLQRLVDRHYRKAAPAPKKITAESSIHDIKEALVHAHVDTSSCFEKEDLVQLARKHALL